MDCGTLISHLQLTWKALDRRTGGSYFNDFTREVPDEGGTRGPALKQISGDL